mmetsp:Transcript_1938/g.2393  ORF Transcript_1938/g.2393 Transcript_1938/m.2393 type:complete len:150 (-) Transcript_1938:246-695(-)
MLDFNPDSRITAEEALTHRFFAPILRNIETFAKTGDEQVGVTPTKDKPIRKSGDTKTRGKEVSSKVFEVPNHLPMPKQWAISEYIDTLDKEERFSGSITSSKLKRASEARDSLTVTPIPELHIRKKSRSFSRQEIDLPDLVDEASDGTE